MIFGLIAGLTSATFRILRHSAEGPEEDSATGQVEIKLFIGVC